MTDSIEHQTIMQFQWFNDCFKNHKLITNISKENEWLEVKYTNIKIDSKNRIVACGRITGETYIKLRDIADLLRLQVGYEKDGKVVNGIISKS